MTTIGTILYTALKGKPVGKDEFGNRYYEARSELTSEGKKKRWVIYEGIVEPTKVPAHWHGWLHYTTDTLPENKSLAQYSWIKESQPNLNGTTLAYVPPGHVNRGSKRAAAVSDYEAWKP